MSLESNNFILGAGEQLVETVPPPARKMTERSPYTPEEARRRIEPRLVATVTALRQVPASAMPAGEGVAKLTLHPQYLSKSAFPADLINDAGLRAIGSKATHILPEKVARKSEPFLEATAEIFVAGKVSSFENLAQSFSRPVTNFRAAVQEELVSIETVAAMTQADRIMAGAALSRSKILECVLHTPTPNDQDQIISAFQIYAASLGLQVDENNIIYASGLSFLSVTGDVEKAAQLAWFTYLRKIRPMPRMRPLLPTTISRATTGISVSIPQGPPLDTTIKAAIFDAALPTDHALGHWVTSVEYGVPPYNDQALNLHGLCVASAATLGPLDKITGGHSPYDLTHHGVLGEDPDGNGYHIALKTIQNEVAKGDYKLINLSFGPDGAYQDDDVDAFTTIVDEILADGDRLAFVAVGNDGDLDDTLGLNKIQPPSDAVNAISVGATDTRRSDWNRAEYSCVGPGRLGCRIKPDLLHFGGSLDEPFGCIGVGINPQRYNTAGTSFSSPASMRIAGSIMAAMGKQLTPIAVKAILIHSSRLDGHEHKDAGHGVLPPDVADFLTCDPTEVKIVYQGKLAAGKYVRHSIPTPVEMKGLVEVTATLCYATHTDAHFPSAYVQAGVTTAFRPHSNKFSKWKDEAGQVHETTIKTASLFSQEKVYDDADERRDAHQWDTVLKAQRSFRSSSILNPCIELHYNRRHQGQSAAETMQPEIPYALVVTVRCRTDNQIYNKVVARYGGNIQILRPRAEVAIRL